MSKFKTFLPSGAFLSKVQSMVTSQPMGTGKSQFMADVFRYRLVWECDGMSLMIMSNGVGGRSLLYRGDGTHRWSDGVRLGEYIGLSGFDMEIEGC